MPFLIDGYNLLHASGVFGRGPGTLENARLALLNFLSIHLEPHDLKYTTIVFDAKDAPPGLPDTYDLQGMTIRFARGYSDADALLEEMIAAHTTPRRLTVVSSDHRVQRAGRKRRATAVDSDVWCNQLVSQFRERRHNQSSADDTPKSWEKPSGRDSAEVLADGDWQKEFADIDVDAIAAEEFGPDGVPSQSAADAENGIEDDADILSDKECGDVDNPFPQEYLDDLSDEL
jgi:predicted RNA-binding protein with PIN domain